MTIVAAINSLEINRSRDIGQSSVCINNSRMAVCSWQYIVILKATFPQKTIGSPKFKTKKYAISKAHS